MSIASLIRSLAAQGATPEVIAIAVEAVEAEQAKLAARRANDAERKARQRAKQSRDGHGTVTGQGADKEKAPQTPEKEKQTHTQEARAREMPADWQPDETGKEFAKAEGVSATALPREVQRFRDFHKRRGTLFRDDEDLGAAWRLWVSAPAAPHRRQSQPAPTLTVVNGAQSHAQPKRTLNDAINDVIARNPMFARCL